MNDGKPYQVLDGTALKLIAMVSMVIDHVGAVFFPAAAWMRMVGRLAMPVFSFCVAEGFAHTRDKKKYLLRMGVFALLSEVPFDLAFEGRVGPGHQNIMLTFFLALTRTVGYYCATGRSFIPLALYNGRRGRGLKWLFYAFYPGHLLVLYAIKRLLTA